MLTRLHDKVQHSDFIKNIKSFIGADQEEAEKLLQDEAEKVDEDPDEKDGEKSLDKYLDDKAYKIDRVAIEMLDPGKPIIPRKVLFVELKIKLQEDIDKGTELKDIEIEQYVRDLMKDKLEAYVQAKHRVDLYNTEGLGLSLALLPDQRAGYSNLEGSS
jgi:hypothetical protein